MTRPVHNDHPFLDYDLTCPACTWKDEQVRADIAAIREKIMVYEDGLPPITDSEYDALMDHAIDELIETAMRIKTERDELLKAMDHILWIKDCGIDGTVDGVWQNFPADERDAMYDIAKAVIAKVRQS